MKVLVIDDEKPTLSMFKLFLTAYGYEVSVAENGEKGLEMFRGLCPDIVFTDIKMPGIDGLEVLRRIRHENSDTQVIIITGHGDMEKALEAMDLNASDFINKPVEREALNSALARAEKRKEMGPDKRFSFTQTHQARELKIDLFGRLSGENETGFGRIFSGMDQKKTDRVRFVTRDGFSVTRKGIESLMAVVRDLRRQQIKVRFENLPYNYARVFQMVDMDKIADLAEEILPE
jgi:YesN/AraC family two-component response regulator